jgi:hypothetical protein
MINISNALLIVRPVVKVYGERPWDVRQGIGYKKRKSNIEAWEFLSAIIYHRGGMFN